MKIITKIKLLTLLALCLFTTVGFGQSTNKMRVLAYYAGGPDELDSYDVNQMTHIIFCFGHLEGNRFKVRSAQDSATIRKMVSLKKKNPQLKVIVSLGGWGGCEPCSDVFSTKKGRQEFAQSIKELHQHFGTDGLDLDWEYPAVEGYPGHKFTPADKQNFTKLVKTLRKLDSKYELSFAAGGFKEFLEKAVEWKKVMHQVDYVNLMTYDLINGYSKVTGHHTGLYSTPNQENSTDFAVNYLINLGIPREQLIVGAAFYGRMFQNVENVNNGLNQPGKFKSGVDFKDFTTQLPADSGYVSFWDETAKAPYLYNSAKKLFFTYDDKRSIEIKTKYVLDNKLGGIMFWQLASDTYTDGLLQTIHNVKSSYPTATK
ncbi:glycoside hydrolase family 18 protein [Adhaeribacter radiodurans]|nr:glycoside hydrolase family 18 protein [Adhaeribacter radiodurans]